MGSVTTVRRVQRKQAAIVGSVLLLHGAGLWGLQSGLLQRPVEMLVPVEVISNWVEPSKPKVEPPPPKAPAPAPLAPTPQPVQRAPQPMPVAVADNTPAPVNAPTGTAQVQAPPPPLNTLIGTPVAAAPVAPAAPVRVELPSSDAEYLHNPKPEYPALSKRRGEQGKVVVNVLIGVDGAAQKAEIKLSSGFERLDQAALATVRAWRYVPGKRGGVPEPMWFAVPLNFVLE
jgi:protein TonB